MLPLPPSHTLRIYCSFGALRRRPLRARPPLSIQHVPPPESQALLTAPQRLNRSGDCIPICSTPCFASSTSLKGCLGRVSFGYHKKKVTLLNWEALACFLDLGSSDQLW